jgi:hypothetical protein
MLPQPRVRSPWFGSLVPRGAGRWSSSQPKTRRAPNGWAGVTTFNAIRHAALPAGARVAVLVV